MASEAQRAANRRYAASGKIGRISLNMARAAYEAIQAYSAARGMTPTQCVRDCVRRCMDADGWTDSAGVGIEPRGLGRSSDVPEAGHPIESELIWSEPILSSGAVRCGDCAQAGDVATCGDVAQPAQSARLGAASVEPVQAAPIKRKPGRPRKAQPETDAQQQPKRGRGRPRKQPAAPDIVDAQPVKRKRGRPRKVQP